MSTLAAEGGAKPGPAPALGLRAARATNAAELSARLALGGAFLSAVASRFGLWDGALDLEHFARFQR
ncbi:MAG TPA: hypothetical protein VFS00_00865, partial [Polyangiaceae bacterium]|nr:hypothetical protein [Polyangiaceae bacterium]